MGARWDDGPALSADRPARRPPSATRRGEHRRNAAQPTSPGLRVPGARQDGVARSSRRRGRNLRLQALWILGVVVVADDLPHEAARARPQDPRRDGLGARPHPATRYRPAPDRKVAGHPARALRAGRDHLQSRRSRRLGVRRNGRRGRDGPARWRRGRRTACPARSGPSVRGACARERSTAGGHCAELHQRRRHRHWSRVVPDPPREFPTAPGPLRGINHGAKRIGRRATRRVSRIQSWRGSEVTREAERLREAQKRTAHWRRWGSYLAERQWGTVREDYSTHGTAWDYYPHDHARSRAYRWGEDGLAGISDNHGR